MSICTNVLVLRVLYYCQLFLKIACYVTPIGLIFKTILDLYKKMISGESSKDKVSTILNRVLACIVIFMIPTFIRILITTFEDIFSVSVDYQSCIVNLDNIKYYEDLIKLNEELEETTRKENLLRDYEELLKNQAEYVKTHMSLGGENGTFIGQKYHLTDKQVETLAKICYKEQGDSGAAMEASLMANRYELEVLKKTKWATRGLYEYVLNCNWWAPAKNHTYGSVKLKQETFNAVKQVLVGGQRVLPFYVNDHDWTGDITKIVTNGKSYSSSSAIKNRSNYIKDQTVIYNKYGGKYTYYTHAHDGKNADPFGYTDKAKKAIDDLNK